jgi:hypothetical protein
MLIVSIPARQQWPLKEKKARPWRISWLPLARRGFSDEPAFSSQEDMRKIEEAIKIQLDIH